jgi:hypothetical protein
MATTVLSIIEATALFLKDIDYTRWSLNELVSYLNEGQAAVVIADPAANIVTLPVTLSAGITQKAPLDCHELMDISLNLGRVWTAETSYYQEQKVFVEGVRYTCLTAHTSSALFATDSANWQASPFSSGPAITSVSEANVFQDFGTGWTIQGDDEDINYEPNVNMWVQKDGPEGYQNFYVMPGQPQQGNMVVEMVYSQIPAPVTIADSITLRDKYAGSLTDYILFRAYSKDMDNAENKDTAIQYWNKFTNGGMFITRRRK